MKKAIIFIICILFIFLNFTSPVLAKKTTQTLIIPQEEIIDSDLLKAAESLIVSGKINGDAYLLGGTITFDGEVTGDLFAIGGVVKISGKIGHDIRAAGGQVFIDAQVGQNISVAGGTVDLSKDTLIPGSILVAAGNLETKAPVSLGAKMAVGRGVINAAIGKDVKILADEELIFGPDTKIGGNLTYRGLKEADFQKGATVSGETKFIPQTAPDKELALPLLNQAKFQKGLKKAILPFKVVNLLITFIIGLVLLKIFPHFFINTSNLLKEKLTSSLGWGLLIILLFPITFILLILTLIGIPIALFVILLFTLTLFLAKLVGSFCLGRWLIKKLTQDERRGWAMLTGLLVSSLMKVIPYLGWLFILGLVTASLGAIALHFKAPSPLSPPKRSPK
jgi:hypothetical protein